MSEDNIIFPTLPARATEAHQTSQSAEIVNLPSRPIEKNETALRMIGEVADMLDLPVHVVRFWQARFGEVRPIKRADGRRYYREADIALLRGLRHLLHVEGYTIKGVHRLIRKKGADFVRDKGEAEIAHHDDRLNQILYGLVADLEQIQQRLKKLVA